MFVAHEQVGGLGGCAGGDQGRPGVGRHRLEPGVDDHAVRLHRADHPRRDRERGAERRTAGRKLHRAILLVHEQVGARLDLGERPFGEVEMVRAGSAAGDDLGRQAGGPQGVQEAREPRPPFADLLQALGQRGDVLQMAVVGLHAAIAQAGLAGDAPRQRGRPRRCP